HDAQLQVHKFHPDAAILDFSFPNGDALELLQRIKSMESSIPVIALVGQGSADAAMRALQDGAEQFLTKPVELSLLHAVLLRVLANQRIHRQPLASISNVRREFVDPFLGTSVAIRRLQELARRVVSSESSILLQGET